MQNAGERAYVHVFKPRITLMTGGVGGFSPEQREKWLSGPSQEAVKSGTNFSSMVKVTGGYAEDVQPARRLAVLLL